MFPLPAFWNFTMPSLGRWGPLHLFEFYQSLVSSSWLALPIPSHTTIARHPTTPLPSHTHTSPTLRPTHSPPSTHPSLSRPTLNHPPAHPPLPCHHPDPPTTSTHALENGAREHLKQNLSPPESGRLRFQLKMFPGPPPPPPPGGARAPLPSGGGRRSAPPPSARTQEEGGGERQVECMS